MKHIITTFIITGILMSCNSEDKTKTTIEEAVATETVTESISKESNKQLKAIDTDEALIATALMGRK